MSLRTRLILIILTPLMLISLGLGNLAFRDAQDRANDRFDRSLLSTALAISRDTALSGGDALSTSTRDLLRDTSGGPVFYHVYAPNGFYVTGYATPPVPDDPAALHGQRQAYFYATYRGNPVRVLRFVDAMSINGLTGDFTFTVWQDTAIRDRFVGDSTSRTFGMIAVIVAALALIVWFGVRLGLRPLLDLQDAIAQRSPQELHSIQRPVPAEVRGIVRTLNSLLSELSATFRTKDEFISNAAHQLRNPIAGVLAMSEAVQSAATMQDVQDRTDVLIGAARRASALANNLLAFERAKTPKKVSDFPVIPINPIVEDIIATLSDRATSQGVSLVFDRSETEGSVQADPVLLREGLLNLFDNALTHGGKSLSVIHAATTVTDTEIRIKISDDGIGIAPEKVSIAIARFGQVSQSEGTGLGLPISMAVADSFGGEMTVTSQERGLSVTMRLPRKRELNS
ncbi:sensor histidine kinase [Loktanella sp. 3ANDIMAR09]|uniref:sensor histidine kinase n=1 Tax=Loktanella sp. 3ANDIMAR09 TaxID=1225657 RepID=UPI000A42BD5B|nr:sensor histidine kinase [Loktanella sp. 3ANDIMAR09]